jgi:hypothetical protein
MPQAPWSASAVEARAITALLPYAGNARTHSAEQVAQIAASIVEFGFVAPVLVDQRGELIAGHGRLLAAKSLACGRRWNGGAIAFGRRRRCWRLVGASRGPVGFCGIADDPATVVTR